MEKAKLEKFRETLLELHRQLSGDVEKARQHSHEEVSGDVPDINDDATRTYSRQVILHIGEKERQQLREVDDALERIDAGDYGDCDDCGEVIPMKRLELIPYAKFCVKCQEKVEEEGSLEAEPEATI